MTRFQLKIGLPRLSAFGSFPLQRLEGNISPAVLSGLIQVHRDTAAQAGYARWKHPTRLRAKRETFGLLQSELTRRANVSLRVIQIYEQHNRNINHVQGATSHQLSTSAQA